MYLKQEAKESAKTVKVSREPSHALNNPSLRDISMNFN